MSDHHTVDYRLGYQQAQLDILRHCLAASSSVYIGSDTVKLMRAILAVPEAPEPEEPGPKEHP